MVCAIIRVGCLLIRNEKGEFVAGKDEKNETCNEKKSFFTIKGGSRRAE